MLYIEKLIEDTEAFRKMKQGKSRTNTPGGWGEQQILVNDEDASFSLTLGIPTK